MSYVTVVHWEKINGNLLIILHDLGIGLDYPL